MQANHDFARSVKCLYLRKGVAILEQEGSTEITFEVVCLLDNDHPRKLADVKLEFACFQTYEITYELFQNLARKAMKLAYFIDFKTYEKTYEIDYPPSLHRVFHRVLHIHNL